MPQETWCEHIDGLCDFLKGVSFQAKGSRELKVDKGFEQWVSDTVALRRRRGAIYLIGNGASASMASHMAADLAKNAQLHTEVFSDLSLVTAISNDMGYEHVFSEPLLRRARRGDMLVAISSSGRSPNILAGVEVANRLKLKVVTLSAMDGNNPLRGAGSLNIYVPAKVYGYAESCHAAILHHWMDTIEAHGKR